jgi:hypothetical protein
MWYDGSIGGIYTGLPPTATLDTSNCESFASGGPNGACCSDGNLTSPPVTPTQSGDFLYGVGTTYGCYTTQYGAGWNAGSYSTNYFGKIDEWRVYNSTSPIGAIIPGSCGAGTSAYVATVAIKVAGGNHATLDNTFFTNSPTSGDTIVGQIGNTNGTSPTYTLGGADAGKFKIVANSGWMPSPTRSALFLLESNGNQGGQANGYNVSITPSDGTATAFHIGPPPPPTPTGTTHSVTTANAQATINAAPNGDTFVFAAGSYGNLTLKPGLYISHTPMSDGGVRATMGTPTLSGNNIAVYGFNITGSNISVTGSNVNFTNNHATGNPVFAPDNLSGATFSWNTTDAGAFSAGAGASFRSTTNVSVTRNVATNSAETLPVSPNGSDVNSNTTFTYNLISFGNQSPRFTLECASGAVSAAQTGWAFNDNYWIHNGLGNSIVSCASFEEARNYIQNIGSSANYGNEVACDQASGCGANVHDNYVDGRAVTGSNNNGGFYVSDANNHRFTNNNFFGMVPSGNDIQFNGGACCTVVGSTHNDWGVPAPFASGAEP